MAAGPEAGAQFGLVLREIECRGIRLGKRIRPMHMKNAVQMRLVLSAAALCAVLAAAIFSGGHRPGLLAIATTRESELIRASSISTALTPSGEKPQASRDRVPAPP